MGRDNNSGDERLSERSSGQVQLGSSYGIEKYEFMSWLANCEEKSVNEVPDDVLGNDFACTEVGKQGWQED